jgi:hypothetical protein
VVLDLQALGQGLQPGIATGVQHRQHMAFLVAMAAGAACRIKAVVMA